MTRRAGTLHEPAFAHHDRSSRPFGLAGQGVLRTLVLLACLLPAIAQAAITATIIDEGTYDVGPIVKVYDAPEQVDGKRKAAKSYTHLQTTRRVEAKLGTSFGFRYRLEGLSTWFGTAIEMRLQHPPLIDTQGNPRSVSRANFTTHSQDGSFRSELIVRHSNPEEDVVGTWILQIVADGEVVVTREFELVPPSD